MQPKVLRTLVGLIIVGIIGSLALPALARRSRNKGKVAKSKKVLPRIDRRFNHAEHDKRVVQKNGKSIACDGICHKLGEDAAFWQVRWDKTEEHKRCFISGCHIDARPRKVKKRKMRTAKGRYCYPCHQKKLKYFPSRLGDVAGQTEKVYTATYSHRKHMSKNTSGDQCSACHGGGTSTLPRVQGNLQGGHQRCSGCHQRGTEPFMNDCAACHKDKSSPSGQGAVVTKRPSNPYRTTGAFNHVVHDRVSRASKQDRECTNCHSNIADGKADNDVPLPTMQGCYERCHNGKKAFHALSNTCTRCHQGGSK